LNPAEDFSEARVPECRIVHADRKIRLHSGARTQRIVRLGPRRVLRVEPLHKWSPADTHAAKNVGNTRAEALYIELKN
jgi:hypothetical protein